MDFGIFLSSEENGPVRLVEIGQQAEAAGIERVWISDHFHPWSDRQGHSPFVWSVLGALATSTELTMTTAVTCPTMRIHPAINAQAAATVGCLAEGRFRFGVGTGENLNEHVLGDGWPEVDVRLEMLEEAVEVIRQLWEGGVQSHRGPHYTVQNARIYDLPDTLPPIWVSAFGPKAAEVAGRIGDGYVGTAPEPDLLEAFEKAGGAGKPKAAGMKVCFGPDEGEARALAHELWHQAGVPGEFDQELPMPAHFEQAGEMVSEDDVAEKVVCGPDPEPYLEMIGSYADAGYDELYLQQIGPDQQPFFEFFTQELRPNLPPSRS